jgi:hypothetical protein
MDRFIGFRKHIQSGKCYQHITIGSVFWTNEIQQKSEDVSESEDVIESEDVSESEEIFTVGITQRKMVKNNHQDESNISKNPKYEIKEILNTEMCSPYDAKVVLWKIISS